MIHEEWLKGFESFEKDIMARFQDPGVYCEKYIHSACVHLRICYKKILLENSPHFIFPTLVLKNDKRNTIVEQLPRKQREL